MKRSPHSAEKVSGHEGPVGDWPRVFVLPRPTDWSCQSPRCIRGIWIPRAERLAVRERQAFGKDEDYYVLFTDNDGYVVTFRGARPMPDGPVYTGGLIRPAGMSSTPSSNRLKEPGLIFESQGATYLAEHAGRDR